MIPMQITYTEYQRAEQPIADFITHLLLMIKKIASPFVLEYRQWGSQIVALNGITQSFTLPLTISYAMAAVMTMRSGDFPGYVACPYWSECTKDTIMITPDYETGQGYTGTGKSTVTWILLAI